MLSTQAPEKQLKSGHVMPPSTHLSSEELPHLPLLTVKGNTRSTASRPSSVLPQRETVARSISWGNRFKLLSCRLMHALQSTDFRAMTNMGWAPRLLVLLGLARLCTTWALLGQCRRPYTLSSYADAKTHACHCSGGWNGPDCSVCSLDSACMRVKGNGTCDKVMAATD
jgi:hypothetical protein